MAPLGKYVFVVFHQICFIKNYAVTLFFKDNTKEI